MKQLVQLKKFKREIAQFPAKSREDIFSLIFRYLRNESLDQSVLKVFKIDKRTKILEFRIKDHLGNWRVISCIYEKNYLALVYAFNKKSQKLKRKDKKIIIDRIKEINI